MLCKTLVLLATGASALGFAGSAQAATMVWSTPSSFVIHPVPCDVGAARPCAFSASSNFTPPSSATRVMGVIYTSALSPVTNMFSTGFNTDFTSASLSGTPLTLGSPDGGITEYAYSSGWISLAGGNSISLGGMTGGDSYIYGDLTFATPEPAAWALMLLGFAGIGGMIRRRRNTQVRAQLAMA